MSDAWSQRRVALELRYAIDVARRRPTAEAIERVRSLIETNRRAYESRHVQHNLGVLRQEWLAETLGESEHLRGDVSAADINLTTGRS